MPYVAPISAQHWLVHYSRQNKIYIPDIDSSISQLECSCPVHAIPFFECPIPCELESGCHLIEVLQLESRIRVPRVKLPSNPESKAGVKLGEGKPENQNAAVIFCFNEAIQSIDMNQVRT